MSSTPRSRRLDEPASATCRWCGASFLQERRDREFCGRRCRQSAFRLRKRRDASSATPGADAGLRFAYADPPYPGFAKLYADQPSYGGEVDHRELIASLTTRGYAGWALSTSSKTLREVLPLCPEGARVAAWVKPGAIPAATYGMHASWEPVIVVGGRKRRPGVGDWLRAFPARGGGDLIGRKPIAFCAWLFDLLGMVPGDTLDDLFPGTGIVGRSWAELSSRSTTTEATSEASPTAVGDAASLGPKRRVLFSSLVDGRHVAQDVVGDTSPGHPATARGVVG